MTTNLLDRVGSAAFLAAAAARDADVQTCTRPAAGEPSRTDTDPTAPGVARDRSASIH